VLPRAPTRRPGAARPRGLGPRRVLATPSDSCLPELQRSRAEGEGRNRARPGSVRSTMRRTAWCSGLLVGVLVILGGCGASGDDPDGTAGAGASPSAPTSPSPRALPSTGAPAPTVPPSTTDPGEPAMPQPQPSRRPSAVPEEY